MLSFSCRSAFINSRIFSTTVDPAPVSDIKVELVLKNLQVYSDILSLLTVITKLDSMQVITDVGVYRVSHEKVSIKFYSEQLKASIHSF